MTAIDSALKFVGSKWFTLILGIGLACVLPFTWHNFLVVQQAGQLTKYWWLVAVFILNVISVLLAIYKFMSQLSKKKPIVQEAW
jgi:hypothetical protein